MTRSFITGISGMVGSHLADYLLENTDWDIWGMIRWRSPLDNIEHLLDLVNTNGRLKLVYADLNDEIALRNAVEKAKPDYYEPKYVDSESSEGSDVRDEDF